MSNTALEVAVEQRYMNLVRFTVDQANAESGNPKILSVVSVKRDFPGSSLLDTLDQAFWRYQNLQDM